MNHLLSFPLPNLAVPITLLYLQAKKWFQTYVATGHKNQHNHNLDLQWAQVNGPSVC